VGELWAEGERWAGCGVQARPGQLAQAAELAGGRSGEHQQLREQGGGEGRGEQTEAGEQQTWAVGKRQRPPGPFALASPVLPRCLPACTHIRHVSRCCGETQGVCEWRYTQWQQQE
jgi:hypothetical protein